jgi:hypothetical protein
MADRYAMFITVGGQLRADMIDSFFDAVENEGVSYDWDGGPFADSPAHLRELIEACDGEPLVMRDSRHPGRFDALEAFCRENGLTFVAHASAGAEADAELRWWTPGLAEIRTRLAVEDGSPAFTLREIRETLGGGAADERLARLEVWLAENTPPEVPPMGILAAASL